MSDTTNISGDIGRNGNSKAIQWPAELELRDYFAAKAMQAMVGNLYESAHHPAIGAEVAKTFMCPNDCLLDTQAPTHPSHEEVGIHDDPVAFSAYRIADAMLRARNQ